MIVFRKRKSAHVVLIAVIGVVCFFSDWDVSWWWIEVLIVIDAAIQFFDFQLLLLHTQLSACDRNNPLTLSRMSSLWTVCKREEDSIGGIDRLSAWESGLFRRKVANHVFCHGDDNVINLQSLFLVVM